MDLDIKKDLTSSWFKLLQEAICKDINECVHDPCGFFNKEKIFIYLIIYYL